MIKLIIPGTLPNLNDHITAEPTEAVELLPDRSRP